VHVIYSGSSQLAAPALSSAAGEFIEPHACASAVLQGADNHKRQVHALIAIAYLQYIEGSNCTLNMFIPGTSASRPTSTLFKNRKLAPAATAATAAVAATAAARVAATATAAATAAAATLLLPLLLALREALHVED
jgi:hypothetical protein